MGAVLRMIIICLGFFAPVWLFTQGFLLSRLTISQSAVDRSFNRSSLNVSKVILIVIDALRYDFVSRTQMPAVWRLIDQRPANCLLVKSIADPPTTTLQRLKGITTGSLPTFVDAGANFASGYINEDNLIAQLKTLERNVTLLGDDTWTSLFPAHFHRSFPFPSFDIKDLDTVDDGILTHLPAELARSDWQLLIAHFLGVDHCGHRYGPNHSEMTTKLTQMDQLIRNVSAAMSRDTALVVIGDHGMTETGDHGGDSGLEVSTTMFIYGENLKFSGPPVEVDPLPQIAIVPTLAFLLDIPIPFSNIGTIVQQLFSDEDSSLISALKGNAKQIFTYLQAYRNASSDPAIGAELQRLSTKYMSLGEVYASPSYALWMEECRLILNQFWAKFDGLKMVFGICGFAENLVFTISLITLKTPSNLLDASRVALLLLLFSVCFAGTTEVILLGLTGCVMTAHFVATGIRVAKKLSVKFSLESAGVCLAVSVWFANSFSNSFVVVEDRVGQFLLQSILMTVGLKLLSQQRVSTTKEKFSAKPGRKGVKQAWSPMSLLALKFRPFLYLLLASILLRTLWMFRRCREEDLGCNLTIFSSNWHNLLPKERFLRFTASSLSLLLLCLLPRRLLQKNGNLVGKSLFELSQSRLVPIALVFVAVYWLIETNAAADSTALARQQLVVAWFVYGIVLTGLIAFVIQPTCVTSVTDVSHNRSREIELANVVNSQEDFRSKVPVLYNLLRRNWNSIVTSGQEEQPHIFVYGLATGYSSSILGLISLVAVVLAFLLGDGMAPSVLFLLLTGALLMEVQNVAELSSVTMAGIWYLVSSVFFYGFGHQPTFPAIPWSAAFVGLPGNFPHPIAPACLVLMNLCASQILVALALPLCHFWWKYPGKTGSLSALKCPEVVKDSGRTEATLMGTDVPNDFAAQWLLPFLAFSGVKLLSTMVSAALLRRHLMVWKIFGPKFVFEAAGFGASSLALLLALLAVSRVHWRLTKEFGTIKVLADTPDARRTE